MKNDQEFNVMFALVIEKYEELYNSKLDKYANRNVKEIAWQKVAMEVKGTVQECKKKWRLLRISLLRHLRESKKPSGSSGKKKKPFYLEDAMKYLIPYTKGRRQTGNADSDEEALCENDFQTDGSETISDDEESVNHADIQHRSEDTNEESQEVNDGLLESPTLSFTLTDVSKQTQQKLTCKKRKTGNSENWATSAVQCLTALSNKYNTNTQKKESSSEEDSDLLFLKSLLPDLRKLNDAQKRRFKQGIFVLYDDILNEDSVPGTEHAPTQSPYSSTVSVSSYDSNLPYCTEHGKEYANLVNTVFE